VKRPMLAPSKIATREMLAGKYPWLVSRKFDGIRCLMLESKLTSRNGKITPNTNLWAILSSARSHCAKNGIVLDGELWSPELSFQEIMSVVMSEDKEVPESLNYHIFDCLFRGEWEQEYASSYVPFRTRYWRYIQLALPRVVAVVQKVCEDWESIESLYNEELARGGEGVMIRNPNGEYKHNRCTVREANMFKLKPFDLADAIVTGYEPLNVMDEDVDRDVDPFGRSGAVHKKGDRHDVEALGALIVQSESGLVEFRIGSGFDFRGGAKDRKLLWEKRTSLIGQWVRYKSTQVGIKNKPRFPVFISFREPK